MVNILGLNFKNNFGEKFTYGLLFFDIVVALCLCGLASVFFIVAEGDEWEHLQASYLVFLGQIPYKDFFEHHHPMLWYLFAPLVGAMERNLDVLVICRYITFLFFVVGLWFVYKTVAEFIYNKIAGLMAIFMMLIPGIFLYYYYFKSDNWMLPCIFMGVYYFFSYDRTRKRKDLVKSYFWFWIAFLFLQKAVIFYPVFFVYSLYMLYKKEMKWSDFFSALAFPLISGVALLGALFYYQMFNEYFTLSYVFNSKMVEYYGDRGIGGAWDIANVIFGLAVFSFVCLYKYQNKYFRLWGFVFILNYASKLFYFAPHVYYFYETFCFALPIAGAGVLRLSEKMKLLLWIVLFEMQIYAGFTLYGIYGDIIHMKEGPLDNYIARHTNRCDYVAFYSGFFMFQKSIQYYWMNTGLTSIVGERMGWRDRDDVNGLVAKYRPKFVWAAPRYKKVFIDKDDEEIPLYEYDMGLIDELYMPVKGFVADLDFDFEKMEEKKVDEKYGLYVLKPEFRLHNCHYDEQRREWLYDTE